MFMKTVNKFNVLKNDYDQKVTFLSFRFWKYLSKTITMLNFKAFFFKEKSAYPNYDFLVRLSTVTKFCSSQVAMREFGQARKWRYFLISVKCRWGKMGNQLCGTRFWASKIETRHLHTKVTMFTHSNV